jgi:hypothetical protein
MTPITSHFLQIGLGFNFLGSLCLICGALFMTEKKSIEVSSARLGPYDKNFPAVKYIMVQRNWAIIGTILLAVGFFMQIFAS